MKTKLIFIFLLLLPIAQAIPLQDAEQIIRLVKPEYLNNVCDIELINQSAKSYQAKAYYNCNGNPLQYKIRIWGYQDLNHYQFRNTLYHELGHINYFNLKWEDKIKALNSIWVIDNCYSQLSTYKVMEVLADNFAVKEGYGRSYFFC